MHRWLLALAVGLSTVPSSSAQEVVKAEKAESISGEAFLAIQSALPELDKRYRRVADHTVRVYWRGEVVTVVFGGPLDPRTQGNTDSKPALQVDLDRRERSILRSHYVR